MKKVNTDFDMYVKVGKWAKVGITHLKGVSPDPTRGYKVGMNSPGGMAGRKK